MPPNLIWMILSLWERYGHTLFVVTDEDTEDKAAIEKLPLLDENAKEELETLWASAPAGGDGAKGKKGKKK